MVTNPLVYRNFFVFLLLHLTFSLYYAHQNVLFSFNSKTSNFSLIKSISWYINLFFFNFLILNFKSNAISRKQYKVKLRYKLSLSCLFLNVLIFGHIINIHVSDNNTSNRYKTNSYNNLNINAFSFKFFLISKENDFFKFMQKSRNKLMHLTHGNWIKSFGIKFFHLNKGNSHFRNKVNQIQIEIDKFKPDIISLSEANIF